MDEQIESEDIKLKRKEVDIARLYEHIGIAERTIKQYELNILSTEHSIVELKKFIETTRNQIKIKEQE